MPISTYMKNTVLDYLFGKTAFVFQDAIYFGLAITTPMTVSTTSATVTEPTAGWGYGRQTYSNDAEGTDWLAATSGKSNEAAIVFGPSHASEPWGTVVSIFISNVASGAGNILWFYNFPVSFAVAEYTTITFVAHSVVITLT